MYGIHWRRRMRQTEKELLEAVNNMFKDDPAILGIAKGKPAKEITHNFTHQYEWIHNLFSLKITESLFFESICGAFYDIHSYKYIEDPTFEVSFRKRMKAIGVPAVEIEHAVKAYRDVIKEVKSDNNIKPDEDYDERSKGWHPDMAGIRAVSQEFNRPIKREEPYTGGGPWPPKK